MAQESVRRSGAILDAAENLLTLDSGKVDSPLRVEDEEILMDVDNSTEFGAFVKAGDIAPWTATEAFQFELVPVQTATGARPKTAMAAVPKANPHHTRSKSAMPYDGRELFIGEELMKPFGGRARLVEPSVRDGIISMLSPEVYAIIPESWYRSYPAMSKALMAHDGFRKAVWDAEVAMADGRLNPAPPREPADGSTGEKLAECGHTGVTLSAPLLFRREETWASRPLTRADWETHAGRNIHPECVEIAEKDIADLMRQRPDVAPGRGAAISILIGENAEYQERLQKLKIIQDTQSEKDSKERERLRGREQKREQRMKDKKNIPRSRSKDSDKSSDDAATFVVPKTHRKKLKEKKHSQQIPDSEVQKTKERDVEEAEATPAKSTEEVGMEETPSHVDGAAGPTSDPESVNIR